MDRYFANRVAAAAIVGIFVFLSTRPALGAALRPNLFTVPPSQFQSPISVVGEERRLYFSNGAENIGVGPLEMYGEKQDSGDCDGDGDPSNDRRVYQRIFEDADNNGFTRHTDKKSTINHAGCMIYHPLHDHWHFEEFALYELKTSDGVTTLAGRGKVTFCVIDTNLLSPGLPGSPSNRYYKSCGRNFKQGISIGWADFYRYTLTDQYIVIPDDLANGTYCFVSTVNPSLPGEPRKLLESNYNDNSTGTKITLTGDPVRSTVTSGQRCPP